MLLFTIEYTPCHPRCYVVQLYLAPKHILAICLWHYSTVSYLVCNAFSSVYLPICNTYQTVPKCNMFRSSVTLYVMLHQLSITSVRQVQLYYLPCKSNVVICYSLCDIIPVLFAYSLVCSCYSIFDICLYLGNTVFLLLC